MVTMLLLFLVGLATLSEPGAASVCSVGELKATPGYQYRVERIRQFVDSASVIVRARAVNEVPATSRIRFEILERLRGPDSLRNLEVQGTAVARDDFNGRPVPYTMVRSAGQGGDCEAREYRLGAEYLLILRPGHDGMTPHWKPLAPFNEQIRGADDPWVAWVRGALGPPGGDGSGA